ncbi:MAG TPA: glycoside hydrolase family 38 C-terminal domain-containing protein [Tepidisphaeraceae bacterium]|jgi:alpha-mannosidase
MKKRIDSLRRFCLLASLAIAPIAAAQTTQPAQEPGSAGKLYIVGYAHLDTQWRWSFPQVISEFLRNTMEKNFPLFDKYPDYIFNFTGANRYMIMQQTYPEDFAKLKEYVAKGRWFPAGSSMEEGDVNMPSAEGIIRQVLYGNEYFRKEFGKASNEFMLPDSFGFQCSLPSILAHCGLKGFSTQKLTWASAVGIPFNIGVWEGLDGTSIVAALNPGGYTSKITDDLSSDPTWVKRLNEDDQKYGVGVDYHYYGTGDQGGAPPEASVQWMEQSVHGTGPVKVVSSSANQMFDDLTKEQIEKLPRYKGDLLLTNHSAGSLTSEGYIKRWNRKNEQLADATERASVIADWLGVAQYPMQKINDAWRLVLASHFHDTMAGTAVPKAYEYSWNNDVIAMNEFAAAEKNAVSGIVAQLDTRGPGAPIVIYNPLSFSRQDVVEATVTPSSAGDFQIVGSDGKSVPMQVVQRNGDHVKVLFLASAPSVGFSTYHIAPAQSSANTQQQSSSLSVTDRTVENARYKVTVNDAGDIASVFDKKENKELLAAPARLAFEYSKPEMYPAWNMDWNDEQKPPVGYVDGPAKISITENGPVRVALQIEREARGSKFIQQIRLSAGDAGNTVEVSAHIDWQTRQCSLKAVFPFAASNPLASYESQSCVIQRDNNNEKKFEVPQQMWLDLTNADNSFGTAVLNDCKYGSDKPDDNTIRLTLLYTPGVRNSFQDQATQDFGRHEMVYALAGHQGDWRQGNVPLLAARLNQPLRAFLATPHNGSLGKEFSMMQISSDHVAAIAMKKAEDGNGTIVRLHELDGQTEDGVHVKFAKAISHAIEVNGQEQPIGPANVKHGELVVDMTPFILRAFNVDLHKPGHRGSEPATKVIALDYDTDAMSDRNNPTNGAFTTTGQSYPAETLPDSLENEGITFNLGPRTGDQKNALACHGQTISIPKGYDRVYLLASSSDGDVPAEFHVGDQEQTKTIQNWTGYIGSWDLRLWGGFVAPLAFDWHNPMIGLVPGFIKRDEVAWHCNYRHDATQGNQYYRFTYLFKYGFDVPQGASEITLPNDPRVKIFAMTVAKNTYAEAIPAAPLYDTLGDRPGKTAAPTLNPAAGSFDHPVNVHINHPLYWKQGEFHYTLDGSQPTENSPLYTKAFLLDKSATVRVAVINADGKTEQSRSAKYDITPAPASTTAP